MDLIRQKNWGRDGRGDKLVKLKIIKKIRKSNIWENQNVCEKTKQSGNQCLFLLLCLLGDKIRIFCCGVLLLKDGEMRGEWVFVGGKKMKIKRGEGRGGKTIRTNEKKKWGRERWMGVKRINKRKGQQY